MVPYCYLLLLSVFIFWFTYYASDINNNNNNNDFFIEFRTFFGYNSVAFNFSKICPATK